MPFHCYVFMRVFSMYIRFYIYIINITEKEQPLFLRHNELSNYEVVIQNAIEKPNRLSNSKVVDKRSDK